MLYRKDLISPAKPPLLPMGLLPMDALWFDIETTGLSAEHSHLYLIGCIHMEENQWIREQWFAERSSEEFTILEQFLSVCRQYKTLLAYNGQTFDLPYLRKKCDAYQLSADALSLPLIDLYRIAKRLQKLLGLSSLHQTDLERFLGLSRKDPYTGKELIARYRRYQAAKQESLLCDLLLHNAEDLLGMLTCAGIFAYERLFSGHMHPALATITPDACHLEYTLDIALPQPIFFQADYGSLLAKETMMTLTLPVCEGTIRLYQPDFKNYVVLPEEQTILPKEMARLTHPAGCRPATLSDCYQNIPVTETLFNNDASLLQLGTNYVQWLLKL